MSRGLMLGKTAAGHPLGFPVAEAVTQTLVVYGAKGMGKTNFGSVFAEELAAAGQRFAVLDPVGPWWGLKYGHDGKSPGIPVLVLGGKHGDLPIEPTAGSVVADLVADEDVNVVVIMRRADGAMWSQGEKLRFATAYALRLFERQGARPRPLMQIVDEAGRFVPQNPPKGALDIMACIGAFEQLVELGRNVGVGVCLITQRSARMNKSVSELAECMVAFRTVGPRSIDAILDWFGEHVPKARWNALVEKLRSLPRGQALLVSPGWLGYEDVVRIRARHTFDSSATPVAGRERRTHGPGARVDLDKYRARMAETVRRAEEEDPRMLKREIERLRKLTTKPAAVVVARSEPKIKKMDLRRVERVAGRAERAATMLRAAVDYAASELHSALAKVTDAGKQFGTVDAERIARGLAPVPTAPFTRPSERIQMWSASAKEKAGGSSPEPGNGLNTAEVRILRSLRWWLAAGVKEPTRQQVALAARYTVNGHFVNTLGALSTKGMVSYPMPGHVMLRGDHGYDGFRGARPTRDEFIDRVRDVLRTSARRKIFDALVRGSEMLKPGDGLTRQDLAKAAGYTVNGHFVNELGSLSSTGIVTYPRPGIVALSSIFDALS